MVEGAQTMFDMTLAGMAIFKNQHHIVGENMTDDEINVFSSLLRDSLNTVQGVIDLFWPHGLQQGVSKNEQPQIFQDLLQVIQEQMQYERVLETTYQQKRVERDELTVLLRKQLDILRTMTEAHIRLPNELGMFHEIERLIQEQQYKHREVMPVEYTAQQWTNMLKKQQTILSMYHDQCQQDSELRSIWTFLEKTMKEQLQHELDFQTECKTMHGFIGQKLTTNFNIIQKLIGMNTTNGTSILEESPVQRMYLDKLEQLIQEMYEQNMLNQAIQESMQETYKTRRVQLQQHMTILKEKLNTKLITKGTNVETTGRLELEMCMVEQKLQSLIRSGPQMNVRTMCKNLVDNKPVVNTRTPVEENNNKVDLASLLKDMDPSVMTKLMKSSMLNNVDPSLLLKYMPTMINNVEPSVIAKFMNPTMWNNVDSADITADMFVGKTYATMTRSERIQWMKTTAKSTLDILLTLRNYIRLHGENMVEGAQTMFDMTLAGMAIFKNQHHIVGENMTDDEINVFSSLLHDSLDTVQGVMVLLFPNGIQHFNLTKNIKTTGRLETEMNMVEEKLQTLLKSGPLFTARTTFNTLGQQLKQTPTTVPVWYNAQTGQIRCRGVEITGLQLAPVVSVIPTVTVNKSVEERDFIDTYRSLRQPINNKVNFSPLQTYMNSSLDHHERQLIEDTLTSITSRKVNYLMPQTCIEPLNQVEIYSQMGEHKPTPVFMIHPIEGHCNTLRNMAKFIRAPVYGIQYTREAMNIETFEELANFYWTKIQQQCGVNTRVNLCGMGFGGIVALEMSMRRPTWCVSLTVLDDNMLPMKDNNWQVDALMRFATQYYQTMNKTEFYNQLIEFRTMEQRIKFVVRELMQKSQIHFDMLDLEEAVRAYVMKYTMMCQYVPLIQLRIPSVYFVRCGLRQPLVQIKTYLQRLVEQCFTGKVETELVDCDVRSFLEGNNGYQVATIMNENLLRQF